MLIEISKKTPFLLIKKALLLITEFELEKTLLIVQGDCSNITLGGDRSILLSYGDVFNFWLIS